MGDLAHDLAALMCSKLCHDLVSPIGAMANGLEVLDDETDAEMRESALELLGASAKAATAKLQFARLAFGSPGGAGGTLDLAMAARAAADYFDTTKAELAWTPAQTAAAKDVVRLCLNSLLLALDCIPRGGAVEADLSIDDSKFSFTVRATGQGARVPEPLALALEGGMPVEELDARLVQPFFTGHLARMLGAELSLSAGEGEILVRAAGQA
jgi:histidine phosphotransferase ChpT